MEDNNKIKRKTKAFKVDLAATDAEYKKYVGPNNDVTYFSQNNKPQSK
jgi:hypothetical protein